MNSNHAAARAQKPNGHALREILQAPCRPSHKPLSRKSWSAPACLLAVVEAVAISVAAAQPFALEEFTLDDGARPLSGGSFTLTGSLAPSTPEWLTAGEFALKGSVWPGLVVPSPGGMPVLLIATSAEALVLSWEPPDAGYAIDAADDLLNPIWIPVASACPVVVPITGKVKFYRLRRQ